MAYAVAILLISALTTVGLLALWAATSTAHWFWRTMGFLAAISPVLLIPAYEPFVAFVIQGAVVAAGVQLAKWRTARKLNQSFFKSQFSVRTVLLAMVPLAVIAAVWVRSPEVVNAAMIGIASGTVCLCALWLASSTEIRRLWKCLVAISIVIGVAVALAHWDEYVSGLIEDSTFWMYDPGYLSEHPGLVWALIPFSTLLLLLIFHFFDGRPPLAQFVKVRIATVGALLLFVAMPAGFIYFELMNPLPMPQVDIPNPNGYDDFLAAARLLPPNPVVNSGNFDSETATVQELQQANDEISMALDRVRKGLELSTNSRPKYSEDDLNMNNVSGFRTMARSFAAQGRLLLKQDRPVEAADVFIDGARFGVQIAKSGLLIDELVGIACSGVALNGLYSSIAQVPADKTTVLIEALERLETERDPWKDVIYRDRVWSQRALGWHGHLIDVITSRVDSSDNTMDDFSSSRNQELAILRLLQLELALRLWKAEHPGWPKSINELVPNYISKIPVDPFSTKGELMKSVFKNDRLIIYSVGRNQDDEAGMKVDDENGFHDPFSGDLRLEILYASEPSTPITQPSVTDEDEEAEAE